MENVNKNSYIAWKIILYISNKKISISIRIVKGILFLISDMFPSPSMGNINRPKSSSEWRKFLTPGHTAGDRRLSCKETKEPDLTSLWQTCHRSLTLHQTYDALTLDPATGIAGSYQPGNVRRQSGDFSPRLTAENSLKLSQIFKSDY